MTKATIKIIETATGQDITQDVEDIKVINSNTGNTINKRSDGYYYLNPDCLYMIDVLVRPGYLVSTDYRCGTGTEEIRIEVDLHV